MKKILNLFIAIFLCLFLSSCSLSQVFNFTEDKSSQTDTKPDSQPKQIFSFALISDPESDLENLKKALQKAKEKNLELVIIPGDLTQTGTPEELDKVKQVLEDSKLDYYLIPGNHDLWYSRKKNTHTFQQFFGPSYYAKKIGDYQLIFLDNSDEYLGMGQAQISWLDDQLLAANNPQTKTSSIQGSQQLTIIFSHIPFFHPESPKAMGELKPALKKEAQDLLAKFCQNQPLAIVSGHLHRAEDYQYLCPDNGSKIRMINAGSVNDKRNLQLPRFLKIELYENKELLVREIELE